VVIADDVSAGWLEKWREWIHETPMRDGVPRRNERRSEAMIQAV
jgi:hypothetical protein